MFSLLDRPARLCDGWSRREVLRVGGLSLLGLSLPAVLKARARPAPSAGSPTFGRAKNCIFLWLQGGPPQHETFDPKPDAPVEIRGPFKPIATNVPGIQFCELLPRTATMADKLAIVRSMATDDNTHSSSAYWVLTGYQHPPTTARVIRPTDWPYFGSLVKMLKPSETMPPLSSVWLPDVMRLNDNVQPAGQTAGFLGQQWDPERFICDPSAPDFEIEGLRLPAEIPSLRLSSRVSLLEQVERHFAAAERGAAIHQFDRITQDAIGLLTGGKARQAFAIDKEPQAVRERYGRSTWGQCVLLARRLIEAGVRLVHVNWTREAGDSVVDNPMWDTHAQNADRLQDVLCPQFDVGFTALVEDLDQRGLLEETLVVAIGEFGRTPKINAKGGRDHWGAVFSFALAGAGIRGAQVYGASDKNGAYPTTDRVEPPDFIATLFHLLGVEHQATFTDRVGRELAVSKGTPIYRLLGTEPATSARTQPTGNIALVPPFDDRPLWNADFEEPVPLNSFDPQRRTRGWHTLSLTGAQSGGTLSARLIDGSATFSHSGERHVAIGVGPATAADVVRVEQGTRVMLTQQVRNPFAGRYTFTVQASGAARSPEEHAAFLKHFTCRLLIFGYQDQAKDPRRIRVFASTTFEPLHAPVSDANYHRFELATHLRSQEDGAYETSLGIGVALVVEKTSTGVLEFAARDGKQHVLLRVDGTDVQFKARRRREDVTV